MVRLEGTWREMGRQYGRLKGKDIAAMYEAVVASIRQKNDFIIGLETEEQLTKYSMSQFGLYPQQQKEVVLEWPKRRACRWTTSS